MFAMDGLPEVPGVTDAAESLRGLLSLTTDLNGLERAADAAKYGRVPDSPHVEIMAPSLHWPQLAPPDKHVILARAHYVPYRLSGGASWDATLTSALADRVLATIESALPCFSSRVLQRVVLTPQDLAERFALTEGAVTHGELGLDQILFMRPVAGLGHYKTPIAGLYLGGAGTHPGPGVLGGPGWLAAQRILADMRANK
jgi:phytoene dehydrogenase-like protein